MSRSPIIGLLLHIGNAYRSHRRDYFARVTFGAQQAALQHGIQLLMLEGSLAGREEWRAGPRLTPATQHVDGWIVLDNDTDNLEQLIPLGKPIIHTVRPLPGTTVLLSDNVTPIRAAVRHLVEHGHRRIGFARDRSNIDVQQRFDAYQSALQEHGLPFDPELVFVPTVPRSEHLWITGGSSIGEQLLARGMPCSAMMCGNDFVAIGLMEAVQNAGQRVPEDLAVIGFDDGENAQFARPPLTTIRQSIEGRGRLALEALLAHIEGEAPLPAELSIPTSLRIRQSCGCRGMIAATALSASAQGRPWQEHLAQQLVACAFEDAGLSAVPEAIWPGSAVLVESLVAAMEERPLPDWSVLDQALVELMTLTTDPSRIHSIQDLLSHAAADQVKARGVGQQAQERLAAFLTQISIELTRLSRQADVDELRWQDRIMTYTQHISARLFGSGADEKPRIDWLQETPALRGYLALLDRRAANGQDEVVIVDTYAHDGADLSALIGERYHPSAFPPRQLILEKPDSARSTSTLVFWLYTSTSLWGLIGLSLPGDIPPTSFSMWNILLSTALERASLTAQLREAKEAAEEANQMKSRFLANMSHELRTPLNAIINFTHFLGDADIAGDLNEQQTRLQDRIVVNSEHLLGLINDVLDLSKVESGKMELHPEQVDLRPILQGVMATAQGLTKEKPIQLILDADDDLPPVWADKVRLRQILLNLLSNAAKFTDQGEIIVRVCAGPPGMLEFSIKDSGIGIAPAHHHLVFEEFRQIEDDSSRSYRGTGLGLPICKRFVEMHGGTMWMESVKGQGSTFFFTLPLDAPSGAAPEPSAAQPEPAPEA